MKRGKIVITYGTFDMFHVGHLNIIRRAKELACGGKLIVGVTTEAFNIERGKVDVQDSFEKRCKNVLATGYVDKIIPDISFPQKEIDIKEHNVELVVMGQDWEGKFDYCKEWCEVIYLPRTPGISTTMLKGGERLGLTPEQHEELRAQYNPDGSILRRQQMRMLDILHHVDKVCKKHNIPYWLTAGTLLGAVRHGGFIPWDDDLDIEMLREDFLRFLEVYEDDEDHVLHTYDNDLHYIMPYAKVRDRHSILEEHTGGEKFRYKGIFVDVFALEYTHKFLSHQTHMRLRRIRKFDNRHKSGGLVDKIILLRKGLAKISISIWRYISNLLPGQQLRFSYGSWCYRQPRDINDIFPLTTVQFEGYDFPAPHNMDAFLRKAYGDYMQIPAEKEVHTKKIEFLG